MVARSHYVNSSGEYLRGGIDRNARPAREILPIGYNQVKAMLAPQLRHKLFYGPAPRLTDNVTNEKDSHRPNSNEPGRFWPIVLRQFVWRTPEWELIGGKPGIVYQQIHGSVTHFPPIIKAATGPVWCTMAS
jgi:hypothetical protein